MAEVNQVGLKLRGHRTATYPISVTVDGRQVWNGTTAANLGYYTIKFPAVSAGNVTITSTSTGALHIQEIEVFGPVIDSN